MKHGWNYLAAAAALTVSMFGSNVLSANAGEMLALPESTKRIEAEAFKGDTSATTVVISKNVEYIGSNAFRNCTGLKEVYFGKNEEIQIEDNAFNGCSGIEKVYAFPNTNGELYALSHGYSCELMEEGATFYNRIMTMITENGSSTSILQSGEFDAKRLIVKTKEDHLPNISAYEPTKIVYDGDNIFFVQFDSIEDTAACYSNLFRNETIEFVEPDYNFEMFEDVAASGMTDEALWKTDDPLGITDYASFIAENGSGHTMIAVVDSGVGSKAVYNRIVRSDGINLVTDNQSPRTDLLQHGSMITGIINDAVGNANVEVLPVRVVGSNGVANLTMIGLGIQYAVERGADVINLSMCFQESGYVKHCIQKAIDSGVTVVAAAGNYGKDVSKYFPANYPGVLTVSGIGPNDQPTADSNYGAAIDYCAPGVYVTSSAYPSILRSGTSFSAPAISAAYALLKLDPYHSESDLIANCKDLGAEGKDSYYGYGLPQMNRLTYINATGIRFTSAVPAEMAVNEEAELTWAITPEKTTDQTVEVVSSDSKVLQVVTDASGTVSIHAVGTGTATVTITAKGGEAVSAKATVRVVQPVTELRVIGAKNRLALTRTMQLTAYVGPENATMKDYTWVSTNKAVATVSAAGLVTPVSIGNVRIYLAAKDGYGAVSEAVSIEVIDIPDAEGVSLSEQTGLDLSGGSILVVPGTTLKLTASVYPEDADQSVSWLVSADPSGCVSIAADGTVSCTGAGRATVTAKTENGKTVSLAVTVAVMPTSVSVNGTTTINVGESVTMTASVSPSDTTDKSVIWSSSNSSVAAVASDGTVTGKGIGTATVTAKCAADPSVEASVKVTVKQPYTLNFNANGGSASFASKSAFSGEAIGNLPGASRDYYYFDGWFTEETGGTKLSDTTVFNCADSVTVYAHWTIHDTKDWIPRASLPEGAQIVSTRTVTADTTNTSMDGYYRTGDYWKETGRGDALYATFPSGFDTGNWYYQNYRKSPLDAWDNGSTKRTVSNAWAGYIYWHWMYNTDNANATSGRAILNYKGTGPDNGFAYKYFGAFTSTNGSYSSDLYYCNSKSIRNYIVTDRCRCWDCCQGALRFFRFDYYKSSYVDYQRHYTYAQDQVQYRLK